MGKAAHYPLGISTTRRTKEEIMQKGSSGMEQPRVNLNMQECHQATLLPGVFNFFYFFFSFAFVAAEVPVPGTLYDENEMHPAPESA